MVHDLLFCGGRVGRGGGRVRQGVFPDAPLLSYLSSYPYHHVLHAPIVAMQFLCRLLLLGLAHCLAEKRRWRLKHICNRKDFFRTLSIEERHQRYQNKIPQCSLIPLKLSPWQKLLASRNDQVCTSPCWSSTANPLITSSKICPDLFRAHTFWQVRDDCWIWVRPREKESGSARGLPRTSVSMDMHQGLASCFTTRVWTYLF